jgi:hypothetical protein
LALEYVEATRRSEAAWIYVCQPWDDELQYETFSYVPEHHFRTAYDRLLEREEFAPDGGYDTLHSGQKQATVYYWLDPRTGAALYHTSAYEDEANPFFGTVEEAEKFLERQAAAADDAERYETLSLYQARTRKVADATDVLTEQAGIGDFVPDGGYQIERYQLRKGSERSEGQTGLSLFRLIQSETGKGDSL